MMTQQKKKNLGLAVYLILGIYSSQISALEDSKSYFQVEKVNYENQAREELNNTDAFGLELEKTYNGEDWEAKVDFKGRFLMNNSEPAYSLQEFYIKKDWENSNLSVGRRLLDWNNNETFWLLGHMNGVSSINFLEPDREGLFGIHYTQRFKNIKLEGFLSYFYLPNLNPSLDIVDGKVVNYGTWGRTPPKFSAIAGRRVEINYAVNRPDVDEVIFKKSLGGRLTLESDVADLSFYGIYKPETSLRMNAEAYAELDATITATANPLVNHHGIYGASLDIKGEGLSWNTNIQVVDPNVNLAGDFEVVDPFKLKQSNRQFTSEFFSVRPNYQKQTYLTSKLTVKRFDQEVGIHAIYLLEGRDSLGDDFLSDAPKWHAALGGSIKLRYSYNWFASASYQYDVQRSDQILQFGSSYYFAKNTSLGFGGKLLRSPEIQSYWYPHRAEDQVSVFLKRFF
jgi:hypothetical protein